MYYFPGNIELAEFKRGRGRDKRKRQKRKSRGPNSPRSNRASNLGALAGAGLATVPGFKKRSLVGNASRFGLGAAAGSLTGMGLESALYQYQNR